MLWKATDWLDLSARYNEAFRAPSLQEKFTSGNHFGYSSHGRATSNKFISNPNLKPEVAKNKETDINLYYMNDNSRTAIMSQTGHNKVMIHLTV